jgi:hypothetical protein
MKSYSANISKLYESVGFEKIEKDKTYTTVKGGKVTIKDIYIDATTETPDCYVSYEFETQDAQRGTETNRFSVVVDMIRNM